MSHQRKPVALDPRVAVAIRHLHHDFPYLGHDGIARLLQDEGIRVDSHTLRTFMAEQHIEAEQDVHWVKSSDPIQALRAFMGVPLWP